MDTVKQILKDYGPAIGPALAFGFGFLALFLSHLVNRWSAKWSLSRRLRHLEILVQNSSPPETFFPKTFPNSLHADEARNLTNLARFYSRLLALKTVFDSLVDRVSESGTLQQISRFHSMKWWFDITLKQVETWRSTKEFRMTNSDLCDVQEHWKSLRNAAANPEAQLEYISRQQGK
jgi:hypothetical protein